MKDENMNLLQLFYAGALVDTANNYAQLGVLDKITEKKKLEQKLSAPAQLNRLGVRNSAELFDKMKEVFGCINWTVETADGTTRARGFNCLMCSIAKKMGAAKPCDLYCINPMRAFGEAMTPSQQLTVEKTLWEGDECVFSFTAG